MQEPEGKQWRSSQDFQTHDGPGLALLKGKGWNQLPVYYVKFRFENFFFNYLQSPQ